MTARHQGLILRAIDEIWNEGQIAAADVLFAPDYVNHGGLIPDLVRGPEAIKISVVLYRRAFPALNITVEDLRTDGEIVTMNWTARNTGPRGPHASAERAKMDRLTGIITIRCRDGKIAESWTDWDSAATLHRAGLTASAGAARGEQSIRW